MKKKKPAKAAFSKYGKYLFPLFILAMLSVYSFFSVIRPFEDDESLYILAGKAIADGSLDPFTVKYYGHYSNPFHYIMGSPLVPLIYGLGYNAGGILMVRTVSTLFVLASIFLAHRLSGRFGGNQAVTLVLTAFSASAITLASDGFMDSAALFFLMSSLYFAAGKKMLHAGVFSGVAMISKFVLVVPVGCIFLYLMYRRNWSGYLAGMLAIAVPFLVLYRDLIPVIANFLAVAKVGESSIMNASLFLRGFVLSLPVASAVAIFAAISGKIKGRWLFLIPAVSIIAFQAALLDFSSLVRHLPYAEFPAAILAGVFLKGRTNVTVMLALVAFAGFGLFSAFIEANYYPSYNAISGQLEGVGGKVLALNLNSFMLLKGMPLNSTADRIYSYYYFSYDNVVDSKIEEYENALEDGFFDYATVSSFSSGKYARYDMIGSLVRKHYCPVFESGRPNGIDLFKRCG